ncbi:MauE/DoxX family redox-associated membrane protein [Microbacterium sp. Mcb102]|uniref:MauE/DoxX family redox-associated membrane protein n=1 Tax=Microbacterium sp. Mcb102 TaxID=2926012 RepID=UPI0021C869DF|nr:MauE/DoxX family redox-associated membrane protein [Microbacterium sp. Mcb102]
MSAFLVPLAFFLAVVFAVSAVGKLRSADHGQSAFAALRIPVRHSKTAAGVLIAAEAVVAVGLLATASWLFVVSAAAALLLTSGLLVAVARAHRLGATDDCGCFGDWLPSAIGPRLIVRNAVLTAIAASVLAGAVTAVAVSEPVGIPATLLTGPSVPLVLGAVGAGLLIAVGVWSLVRASNAIGRTDAQIPRGAGAVLLPGTAEIVDLLVPAARARLLVFVAPECHACAIALASLKAAEAPLAAVVDVYVIQRAVSVAASTEPPHDLPASTRFALDVGGSVAAALRIGAETPVAALIGTDGTQAGPLAVGSDEVRVLIDSIRAAVEVSPA